MQIVEFTDKLSIKQANKKIYEVRDRPTIYFAHPYDKWKTPQEKWIMERLEEMGYRPYNPFEEEEDINEKYGVKEYYESPFKELADEIVLRDFQAVDNCDAYFAWIPKGVTTIGTVREFDRAVRNGKHTIILCYKPNPFLRDAKELYLSYKDFMDGNEYKWTSYKDLKKFLENQ